MKKIIIFTLFLWIFFPNYSYANWVCLIKDKSAQVLLDYIKDNKKVIKNVSKWIIAAKNKTNNRSNDSSNNIIKVFNDIFTFTWFYSYFTYYVPFQISNEIPYQVTRDYDILNNENKWLVRYLKKISKDPSSDTIVENACNWVSSKCDFENKKAIEIVWELLKNNDKILHLFRKTVTWETDSFKDVILVNNNFELELEKYYSTKAINLCNQEEWTHFTRITESLGEIKILNKLWEDWIEEWKEAWQLLIWAKPDETAKTEKKELKKYLSNEWLSWDNQEIMLNNLEKYNSEWVSQNNNFLSNTFRSVKNKVNKQLQTWKDETFWDFIEKNTEIDKEKLLNNDVTVANNNSVITKLLEERITNLYETEIPFTVVWDITTENLRSKIIDTHFSLESSIATLEKIIPISRKICRDQDWKRGDCE